MAWQRDEANLGISGATAYSYTEVDWEVHGDKCTYRHIGGVTSPYNFSATATSTLQWWESGTWHDYAGPASATFNGYGDLPLVDVEDYFVRQAADRVVSLGTYTTMMGGSARSYIDYTVPHLAPSVTWASSNPVVRNSDNSITLTWNAPALEYSAMCLEVSTDGGAWSQFAVLWNTATSYTWNGCSADHSYKFRIRTNYLASYSAYDTCATVITMTPAAPTAITTAAAGGTNVTVTLVNPSTVATKVQYEVSTDDGATWGAVQDSASLTSFTVSASGTVKIRVRNYNATGTSAWLTSDTVTTICPPAKPTITSPQTGAWDVSQPLDVAWLHNSLDGSAQEAYKLRVTKLTPPLASHTETYSPSTASTQSITWADVQGWLPTLALGDSMAVGIATKGADASYSSFGTSAGITPFTAPTLSITSPSATVTGMPIQIEATYSDMTGYTCQAATVTLKSGDRTILTKPATISGNSLSCEVSLSDALLDNGAEYTIVLDVRSSSGLQASANATFTTAFTEPQAGTLSITNDPDTGYASLLATFDNHASDVEYSGATNAQFDTTEGYVRSLTVEGKSEKWNQFADPLAEGNTHGLTVSIATDGTVTLNGTATSDGTFMRVSMTIPNWKSGKVYAVLNCPVAAGKVAIYRQLYNDSTWVKNVGYNTDEIITINDTATANRIRFMLYVYNGATFSSANFKPLVIDLTAIFGAGNEPATVDAFKATDVYKAKLAAGELYDYDAGSLVSIEGVGVRGRNLLDPSVTPTDYEAASYSYADGTFTVTATTTTSWPYAYFEVPVAESNKCSFSCNSTAGSFVVIQVKDAANNNVAQVTTSAQNPKLQNIDVPQNAVKVRVVFYGRNTAAGSVGDSASYSNIMLEGGSTAHAYTPYITPTTITTPLRSAGSIADELQVDKTDAQVARKVGAVDLGTLTWYYYSSGNEPFMYTAATALPNIKPSTNALLCAAYQTNGRSGEKRIVSTSTTSIRIFDSSYTDPAAFKTSLDGVMLFYELAEASQTTDTLPDVPLIELGTAATVTTDLDSTFEMVAWDGSADAVSISVARVNADGITPLIEDAASGAGAVDKYAPLNKAYQYAVTTKSSADAVKTVYVDNEIITDLWFAYWGENIASAKWNPDNGGIQIARPQKTRVYYAGRKDPVSYDGAAVSLSETPSWMLVDRSEVQPFVQLIEDGGRGVYKSCDGWVYHADFDLTLSPKYTAIGYYGGVGLSVTRIAGEQL